MTTAKDFYNKWYSITEADEEHSTISQEEKSVILEMMDAYAKATRAESPDSEGWVLQAAIIDNKIYSVTGIDEDGDVVAEFMGDYQLQLSKSSGQWKVTNGVDGWGNNCAKDFESATVTPLYALPSPPSVQP